MYKIHKKKIITWGGAITKVKVGGREASTTEEILKEEEWFYEDLYSAKDVHEETAREIINFLAKEVNSQNSLLSQDFTILEMHKTLIKGFKQGKAPGADGHPLEFYLTFWDILAHKLLAVFNNLETLDRLPDIFRIGIVSLLYKKGDKLHF